MKCWLKIYNVELGRIILPFSDLQRTRWSRSFSSLLRKQPEIDGERWNNASIHSSIAMAEMIQVTIQMIISMIKWSLENPNEMIRRWLLILLSLTACNNFVSFSSAAENQRTKLRIEPAMLTTTTIPHPLSGRCKRSELFQPSCDFSSAALFLPPICHSMPRISQSEDAAKVFYDQLAAGGFAVLAFWIVLTFYNLYIVRWHFCLSQIW